MQSPVRIESVKRALMLWSLTVGDFDAGLKYEKSNGTNSVITGLIQRRLLKWLVEIDAKRKREIIGFDRLRFAGC